MKKHSILIILLIFISIVSVNAQCYSLSYRDFDVADFIDDADTLGCEPLILAHHYSGEDTTSRIQIHSTGGKEYAKTQVFIIKKQESMREIQSRRVAFFTTEMSLTPEEAEVFWPLYNQYSERKNKLVEEQKKHMKRFTQEGIASMSNSEAEAMANAFIKLQEQESELVQEYHRKFMRQLPAKKVLQLYKAEKDFMQNLLRNLKGPRKGKDL